VSSFIVKASGGTPYEPAPAGSHAARCIEFVDLGTQESTFQGQTKSARKVRLKWELPLERMEDGRPFTVSKTYTASLHEKAQLRKDLEGWRGKNFTKAEEAGFDISSILGKTCQLTVLHEERDGKSYATVKGVGPLTKGLTVPPQENPSVFFSLDAFDAEVFMGLGKFAIEKISQSPEYQRAVSAELAETTLDESDIPF
jgi:hypothetical protein